MNAEERKSAYENSALRALIEASGHEICERCYCCDLVPEWATCWQCGGFEEEEDPEWPSDVCSVCKGEGEIYFTQCVGNCDDHGEHIPAPPSPSKEGR